MLLCPCVGGKSHTLVPRAMSPVMFGSCGMEEPPQGQSRTPQLDSHNTSLHPYKRHLQCNTRQSQSKTSKSSTVAYTATRDTCSTTQYQQRQSLPFKHLLTHVPYTGRRSLLQMFITHSAVFSCYHMVMNNLRIVL